MPLLNINLMFILAGLAVIVFLSSGIALFITDTNNRIKQSYFALMLLLALWNCSLVIMNLSHDVRIAVLSRNIGSVFWVLVYPTAVIFFVYLSNAISSKRTSTKYLGGLYIPSAIFLFILYTILPYTENNLILTGFGWCYISSAESPSIDNYLLWYMLPFILIYIYQVYNVSRYKITRRNLEVYKVIFVTLSLSLFIGTLTDIIIPSMPSLHILPVGSVSVAIFAIAATYAVFRYNFYSINSPNATGQILEAINEAVILTDESQAFSYLNHSAYTLLGIDPHDNINLYDEIITQLHFETPLKQIAVDETSQIFESTDIATQEVRYYSYDKSYLSDDFGEHFGEIYVFSDITNIVESEREIKAAYASLEKKVALRTQDLMHKTEILNTYNIQLKKELAHRKEMESHIKALAFQDSLTGLSNRRMFIDELNKLFKRTKYSQAHALLYLDIHNFKAINDNLGRKFGDDVLIKLAKDLTTHLPENALIARLGSDEFAILIKNFKQLDDVAQLIDTMYGDLCQTQYDQNIAITLAFSIGIALFPMHSQSPDKLINCAEIALREAKKQGKNNYLNFKPHFQVDVENRFRMINDLKRAVENHEFVIHYQPQVSPTATGHRIIGLEALVRWQPPDSELIYPGAFINVAERSKQIIDIGEQVIRQAIEDISQINRQHQLALTVAINISGVQFDSDRLYFVIKDAIDSTAISPSLIELELTESVLVSEVTKSQALLKQFKHLGVKVAIDDFGIEYSSLNYLKSMPIDKIKLDMSFVAGIGQNIVDESILETMMTLSHRLNLNTLAEGVENKRQLDFLITMGCQEFQGYYYYRPMPLSDILKPDILKYCSRQATASPLLL